MQLKNVLLFIIVNIIMVAAGVALGIFYQQQTAAPAATVVSPANSSASEAIKILSSKNVPSFSIHGSITKINGSTLTLTNPGETFSVTLIPGAKIYVFTTVPPVKKGAPATTTSKEADFKVLKTGDNISISLKVLPTGQVQGLSAVLLPPLPSATPSPSPSPATTPK